MRVINYTTCHCPGDTGVSTDEAGQGLSSHSGEWSPASMLSSADSKRWKINEVNNQLKILETNKPFPLRKRKQPIKSKN